jgi:hypothetical protein
MSWWLKVEADAYEVVAEARRVRTHYEQSNKLHACSCKVGGYEGSRKGRDLIQEIG